jgi:hypothetical protein
MEFKYASHLFLGLQELNWFKKSVQEKGYKSTILPLIAQFGVIKTPLDTAFDALRVIQGSTAAKLTIKAGNALDSSMNQITVLNDLVDEITVPTDNVIRYVKLKYATSILEEGIVSISTSGQITGTGTVFTQQLRGLPNFPSKISFPNSVSNTGEFEIASVSSDTIAQLNVPLGSTTVESNLRYRIVGTFSPGTVPTLGEKYPYIRDWYSLSLETTNTVIEGEEFLLCSVQTDGVVMSIIDLRSGFLLTPLSGSGGAFTATNNLIGYESVQYNRIKSPKDLNLATIGWGIRMNTWTYNVALSQITVTQLSGGIWKSIANATTSALNGWRIFIRETGESLNIVNSVVSGSNYVLTVEASATLTSPCTIAAVPQCETIELEVLPNSTYGKWLGSFNVYDVFASIPAVAGVANQIRWRAVTGDQSSSWNFMNTGNYYNEAQYDSSGVLIGAPVYTLYTSGNSITPVLNALNHEDDKASRTQNNTFLFGATNIFEDRVELQAKIILGFSGAGSTISPGTYNNVPTLSTRSLYKIMLLSAGTAIYTGFTAGAGGDYAIIRNISNLASSTNLVQLNHEDTGSLAANRMILAGASNRTLKPGESVVLLYDEFNDRWIEIGGAVATPWITDNTVASNTTISAAGTAGVDNTTSVVYYKIDSVEKIIHIQGTIRVNAPSTTTLNSISYALPSGIVTPNGLLIHGNMFASATGSFSAQQQRPAFGSTLFSSPSTNLIFSPVYDTSWTSSTIGFWILTFNTSLKLN